MKTSKSLKLWVWYVTICYSIKPQIYSHSQNLISLKNIGPNMVYCRLARFDLHQFEGVPSDAIPIDYIVYSNNHFIARST